MFFPNSIGAISFPEAIRLGKRRVIYPTLLLFFLLQIAGAFVRSQVWWAQVLSFVVSVAIIALYWSVAAGRWRVWAFSRVTDIHSLHERALADRIIPDYRDWVYGLEWKTPAQKDFWAGVAHQLELGPGQPPMPEDFAVPDETAVYYDRSGWWLWVLTTLGLGVYTWLCATIAARPEKSRKDWFILIAFPAALLFFGKIYWRWTRRLFVDRAPLLTLDRKGLVLKGHAPVKWKDIHAASVQTEGYGDNQSEILILQVKTGEVEYLQLVRMDVIDEYGYPQNEIFAEPVSEEVYNTLPESPDKMIRPVYRTIRADLAHYGIEPAELAHRLKVYQKRFKN